MKDFRSITDEFFYNCYTRAWPGTTQEHMPPVYRGEMDLLLLAIEHGWCYSQEVGTDYPLALHLTQEVDGHLQQVKKPQSPYQILWKPERVSFLKEGEELLECSHKECYPILSYYIEQLERRFGASTGPWKRQLQTIRQHDAQRREEKIKNTLTLVTLQRGRRGVSFEGAKDLHLHTRDVASFRQLKCQETLRSLDVDCMPRTKDVEVLSEYTHLQSLYLRAMKLQDISFLAPLTQLEQLGLFGNQITDLSPLAGMKKLTYLFVEGNPIKDFSVVEQLPKLRNLYVDDEQMPDASVWEKIPERINLTVEHLTPLGPGKYHAQTIYTNRKPAVKPPAEDRPPDPKRLDIKDRWLYSGLKNALGHDPTLRYDLTRIKVLDCSDGISLCVDHSFLTDMGDYSCLKDAGKLHTLNLSGRVVDSFDWLKGCTSLKNLDLSHTSFGDLSLLMGCTQLTSLNLEGCKNLQKSDMGLLDQLPRLKRLQLAGTALSEYVLPAQPPQTKAGPSGSKQGDRAGKQGKTSLASYQKGEQLPPAQARPAPPPPERLEGLIRWLKAHTGQPAYTLVIEHGRTPGITDSKLGGLPYWDGTRPYPTDRQGRSMCLLAQIRLSDLPGASPLPSTGLLQFFVAQDGVFGLDEGAAVVWHESISPRVTAKSVARLGIPDGTKAEDILPFEEELALSAQPCTGVINPADFRFEALFAQAVKETCGQTIRPEDWYDFLDEESEIDPLFAQLGCGGHQMLGYGHFAQDDPRIGNPQGSRWDTMLLQLDSDEDVLWGDLGTAHFFIAKEDLEKRDFRNIWYDWDCY